MDALFAREVQFFVRRSGKLLRAQWGQTNPASRRWTEQAAAWKKTSPKALKRVILPEFSRPQIPLPDREFESVPLRQLSRVFPEKFRHSKLSQNFRGLAAPESVQAPTESEGCGLTDMCRRLMWAEDETRPSQPSTSP